MSCCPSDSEPARQAATYASATIKVGQTTIYRAGPPTASVGVLAFPDIYGLDSGRAKQDADRLGELGYAVAFVDLTDGDYAYEGWNMVEWIQKQAFDTVLLPRIQEAINYLKSEALVSHIASYGYCWGAWVGARLSAVEGPLINGHISFHPSWRVENMLHGDGAIEKLAEIVKVPQLLLSAGNDLESLKEGGSVQKILAGRDDVNKLSKVVNFLDVKHGWVNRGDVEDPAVKEAVDKAWQLARAFIKDVCASA